MSLRTPSRGTPASAKLPPSTPSAPLSKLETRHSKLSSKRQGELAELAFIYRAASLGLLTLLPHGDSAPYDVVLDTGRRFLRVQIKSAARPRGGAYEVNAGRGRYIKRAYTRRDIDFLAAWLIPDDTWYILPVSALRSRKTLRLPTPRFSRYREAWHLLLGVARPRPQA